MSILDRLRGNLRLPAIAAPMFLVSGPEMVVAACKAGVIGAFPTPNARTTGILEQWLCRIEGEVSAAPDAACFAANLVVHRSNARRGEDPAFGRGTTPYNCKQGDATHGGTNPCVAPI